LVVRNHGSDYARRIRRKVSTKNDVGHLDEVAVRINGRKCWLWRAVDQDGYGLDEIVQTGRNTKAAKRLLTRLLKKQGLPPKRMITDKLRSYGAARRQLMPIVEHRSHKRLNNRAENSHLPFRKRERTRQGLRSIGSLQQFVSAFSTIRNHFVLPKSKRSASQIQSHRRQAMVEWKLAAEQIA
jgi:putative transposase